MSCARTPCACSRACRRWARSSAASWRSSGCSIGLGPLNDNSFLTHLATGRLIWDTHHIPRTDPYSFTALGPSLGRAELARVACSTAAADKWWGPPGVLLVVAAAATTVAALVWTLTRPARLADQPAADRRRRCCSSGPTVAGSSGRSCSGCWRCAWCCWRPKAASILGGCVPDHVAVGQHPRLVPARAGRGRRSWRSAAASITSRAATEVRASEVGRARHAGRRRSTRSGRACSCSRSSSCAARTSCRTSSSGRRRSSSTSASGRSSSCCCSPSSGSCGGPSWRAALPLVVFTAASLLGARNVVVASIVFVPGLARGLADLGTVDGRRAAHRSSGRWPPRWSSSASWPCWSPAPAAPCTASTATRSRRSRGHSRRACSRPDSDCVVTRLRRQLPRGPIRDGGQGLHRRPLRHVPGAGRATTSSSSTTAGPAGRKCSIGNGASAVLWPTDEPLGQLLAVSPQWRVVYTDQEFLIAEPR